MARPAGKASKRACPAYPICRPRSSAPCRPWLACSTTVPKDRRSAQTLGAEREGHGVLISDDGLIVTIGYLIMEADTVTITDIDGNELPAYIVGYDYESGFGLVRTERPVGRQADERSAIPTRSSCAARPMSRALGGEKATLKVKVAGRREFAGYWEYLLDNAIFTVPAYPLWGGSALIGQDGTLLGIGSLLVQEALGPGAPAFPGNMYVPINRLKPIFEELVDNGRLSTPPRPWLGLLTVEHMGQLVVGGISDGGPADRAGLQRGDVLHALNGEVLDDLRRLLSQAVGERPGRHGGDLAHGARQRFLRGHGAHRRPGALPQVRFRLTIGRNRL